jgi:hypothetical protein
MRFGIFSLCGIEPAIYKLLQKVYKADFGGLFSNQAVVKVYMAQKQGFGALETNFSNSIFLWLRKLYKLNFVLMA